MSDYYKIKEAAEVLGVSKETVYRLIRTGQLKAKQVNRRVIYIEKSEVDLFVLNCDDYKAQEK